MVIGKQKKKKIEKKENFDKKEISNTIIYLYFLIIMTNEIKITVIWAIIIILIISIIKRLRHKSKNVIIETPQVTPNETIKETISTPKVYHPAYHEKEYFFSYKEREFMNLLKKNLEKTSEWKYDIFPKTRLADIFNIDRYSNHPEWDFNRIKAKHIDFLIVNTTIHYTPVLWIELNGDSHNTEKAHIRDQFVKEIFDSNEIPFLIIENQEVENEALVIEKIREKINI